MCCLISADLDLEIIVTEMNTAFQLRLLLPLRANRMTKHLRRHLTQQLRLVPRRQLLKHTIHALPSVIPHRPQPIPGHRSRNRPRKIRNDEPHGAAAQPADHAPELAGRGGVLAFGHALLAQHLFEDGAELLVAEAGGFFFCGGVGMAAFAEEGPGEIVGPGGGRRGGRLGIMGVGVVVGCGGGGKRGFG